MRVFFLLLAPAWIALGCENERPTTSRATPSAVVSPSPSTSIAAAPVALPLAGKIIERVEMISATNGWMLADGRAWQTRDGGATFVDRTPFEGAAVDSLLASSQGVLVLRGTEDQNDVRTWTLFVSEDDGVSFTRHPVGSGASRGGALQRGPHGALLLRESDDGGMNSHAEVLLESFDGGSTFRKIGSKTGYGSVTFQTATVWWTVGTCCAAEDGIFRSTDAGVHWTFQGGQDRVGGPVGFAAAESDVVFLDGRRGYRIVKSLAGPFELEKTTDGARSFSPVPLPFPPGDAGATAVLEADRNACILQHDRDVFATRDEGATWTRLPELPGDATLVWRATTVSDSIVAWSSEETSSRLIRLGSGATAWEALTPKFG